MMNEWLCPDIPEDDQFYKVRNKYTDVSDRVSFQVEIHKCSKALNKDCKDESEINDLLSYMYFTLYIVQDRANFEASEGESGAIVTSSQFHS